MPTAANLLAIMPFPDIDPIAFSIGPLAIHWYGLAYVAGILLGWAYARRLAANDSLWPGNVSPISRTQLDDFIVWAALGVVLGGRLGYIFFYDLPAVMRSPVRALEIWNGGMSFHGGLTGTTIAMILFARRNRIPIWSLFDIVATVVPCGLFFGRIANFVNGELWGRPTDEPWGIIFPHTVGVGLPDPARHPSQLYEAGLEGIILFLILSFLFWRTDARYKPGLLLGVFLVGYGCSRFIVEYFREPDAQLGILPWGISMGQTLSAPMIFVGLWFILTARNRRIGTTSNAGAA